MMEIHRNKIFYLTIRKFLFAVRVSELEAARLQRLQSPSSAILKSYLHMILGTRIQVSLFNKVNTLPKIPSNINISNNLSI